MSDAFAILKQFARERPANVGPRCDLCGEPIGERHAHLLELASGRIECACRACAFLFEQPGAAQAKRKRVPDRRLRLNELEISDAEWDRMNAPVGLVFFCRDSRAERVIARYPSPVGPMESRLELDAWSEIESRSPAVAEMNSDVEALLVNRLHGAHEAYLLPIDVCYELIGLIRANWKGMTGGTELWKAVDQFFDELRLENGKALG